MDRYDAAAVLLCVVVFLTGVTSFLPHQDLWVDEATQLRGLELGPVDVTRWLAGADYGLDVPGDRSPPLSYWVGQLWRVAASNDIRSLRWMGVVLVALAIPPIYLAARTAFSREAGLAASLLFALSPNVVVVAVEIRAYPLFLLLSAWTLFFVVRVSARDSSPSRLAWALLVVTLIAAAYTHYFGVVLGSCCILTLLLHTAAWKRTLKPVLTAGAVVASSWAGLIPFVLAASTLSTDDSTTATVQWLVELCTRLAYRLIGHPAVAVVPGARLLLLLAAAVCIASALYVALRDRTPATVLLAMLAAGFGIVAIAAPVVPFNTGMPEYNLWMLSALFLLLASPVSSSATPVRIAGISGVVIVGGVSALAVVQLGWRGEYFAHTRSQSIAELVGEWTEGQTIIVHDTAPGDATGIVYYALRHLLGPTPPQYLAGPIRHDPPGIVLHPFEGGMAPLDAVAADRIVVMRSTSQYTPDLVRQIRFGDDPRQPGNLEQYLLEHGYTLERDKVFVSLVRSELAVLVKGNSK